MPNPIDENLFTFPPPVHSVKLCVRESVIFLFTKKMKMKMKKLRMKNHDRIYKSCSSVPENIHLDIILPLSTLVCYDFHWQLSQLSYLMPSAATIKHVKSTKIAHREILKYRKQGCSSTYTPQLQLAWY